MYEALQKLTNSLKASGHSLTNARKLVFLALFDKEPQTMAALVKTTSQIDRASVYRTVSLFEQLGIVNRLQMGWKYKLELSEQFGSHHHHITCISCSQIQAIHENTAIEQEIKHLGETVGFTTTGHQLELRGMCSYCRPKPTT